MDLFDEIRRQDEEEMSVPGGLNLNSHLDMFNAVLCKVSLINVMIGRGTCILINCLGE